MYLDDLDELLRAGAALLSPALRQRQRRFVLARQRPDGGFPGRLGESDLYYTDFALRVLTLLEPATELADRAPAAAPYAAIPAIQATAAFVTRARAAPHDVVGCFSALNAARMLARWGVVSPAGRPALLAALSACRLEGGGFSRTGGNAASAYQTFLAALCHEMLGLSFPALESAVVALTALRRPDGGFTDLPGVGERTGGQTNPTAAAVAFLIMNNPLLPVAVTAAAVSFLGARQTPEGGFRASAGAPEADLLSTFTALTTLFALDGLTRVDLRAAIQWVGGLADEAGGFRASPSDPEPDIEYTFYGLGALALLRAYIGIAQGFA